MFFNGIAGLVALACVVSARPLPMLAKREVPQEHSHEKFLTSVGNSLNLNNPDEIVDPVFALLGNDAAQQGLGKIQDPDCLQQAVADQAFTNAKAAGDLQGQVDALIFRALERNSGSVGATTNACTSIQAVNPEIAAIQQHQDPASDNAAEVNKNIVLALAQQIASIGGNPLDALQSGTFAPGQIGDPTAKGNTCDDANDSTGCIFTQNLLVEDASEDEINQAVSSIVSSNSSSNNSNINNSSVDGSNVDFSNGDNSNFDNSNFNDVSDESLDQLLSNDGLNLDGIDLNSLLNSGLDEEQLEGELLDSGLDMNSLENDISEIDFEEVDEESESEIVELENIGI
ncbi:uncharacterized protein FOMMEDRAFT_170670 [Fomitiporia mediterranea MF3/22]|uniref:uncharacterized protein n=1 Tax=Fomitiporia mediterranea (strain MF3/22) TaxID=694068 RepID=UPI0004409A19|nr:uncharacterized protein FOMMEDRAFT_170670 [Fomitiporia mediterranea MF3/22]EJC98840.1 hypothetical protein FOMMEDRAFT_170670 [Fomitiporia mediterranea MF3/22]